MSYWGGSMLCILANGFSEAGGGSSPTGESMTESGIATRVSSKNDLIVCKSSKAI